MNLQRKVVSESCLKMALGRGKLISVIGDEDTCVGNKLFFGYRQFDSKTDGQNGP